MNKIKNIFKYENTDFVYFDSLVSMINDMFVFVCIA